MHVAIDAELIGRDRSGNETYLTEMVMAMQRVAQPSDNFSLVGPRSPALERLAGAGARVIEHRRGLAGDLTLGLRMRGTGASVALATYNAPLWFGGARATIVHDVAFRRVPETFPSMLRRRIELSVARSVRVSDLVVTVSDFSRDELCTVFPRLDSSRVVVTYEAAAAVFSAPVEDDESERVRRAYDLPDRFALAVGNVQPRKNLLRLMEAARKVGVPLVAVGQQGWLSRDGLASELASGARWLGWVPTADLAVLYRLCSVFAYPSLYEGFGLPVVEAMAAGAIVVTSRSTALAEIAGDGAILVDPTSTDAIADGLAAALNGAGNDWRAAARTRAATFSWDDSARRLLSALRTLDG